MAVQILRICLRKYRNTIALIKEIRKDFHIHSPFSILNSQFKQIPVFKQD